MPIHFSEGAPREQPASCPPLKIHKRPRERCCVERVRYPICCPALGGFQSLKRVRLREAAEEFGGAVRREL